MLYPQDQPERTKLPSHDKWSHGTLVGHLRGQHGLLSPTYTDGKGLKQLKETHDSQHEETNMDHEHEEST